MRYVQSIEVKKWDQLAYIVNKEKTSIDEIKTAFKELFQANDSDFFNAVWNKQILRADLLTSTDEVSAFAEFQQLISNTNSKLYKFIKDK